MKKYLITGFSGFVSYYFLEYLNSVVSEKTEVMGIDLIVSESFIEELKKFENLKFSIVSLNMLDFDSLEKQLVEFNPTHILHLASFSSVSLSWNNPAGCFLNNTSIFLNLVEAIRKNGLHPRLLSIGSSEEYGVVDTESLPLLENTTLNPSSPYAIARVSQEQLSLLYQRAFGIDIVITRSFNHIGPRQKDVFVIPHFVKEIISAKKQEMSEIQLRTGDTSIIRDFLDVRDVVRAYYVLLETGKSGEVYNVCSGIGNSLSYIISILEKLTGLRVVQTVDKDLLRPIDNPIIIGNNEKLKNLGWNTSFTLEQSLQDIIDYWSEIV